MSVSDNIKLLVSGCGLSWSEQERRTYVNVIKSMGVDVVDVSGPGVSNQYIFNSAIQAIINCPEITRVIVQTTFLGKLDVDIGCDLERQQLVDGDPIRNFTHNGIWPSSNSDHHVSKQLYNKWLVSIELELTDIVNRIVTFDSFCRQRGMSKVMFIEGYPLPLTEHHRRQLADIVFLRNLMPVDDSGHTPALQCHVNAACTVSDIILPEYYDKIIHAKRQYDRWRQPNYVLK